MPRRLAVPMLVVAGFTAILIVVPVAGSLSAAKTKTHTKARDRDHDRLPDAWEKHYRLSTHVRSTNLDPDRDGLTNLQEYRTHTNPRRWDTDHDGLGDGAELRRYHTNPVRADTDGDGISDGAEVRAGTDPRRRNPKPKPVSGTVNPGAGGSGSGSSGSTGGGTTASGCASKSSNVPDGPDPWGGCFPGPSNTGVPAGTTLTNYTGPCTITTANTIIDAKTINCDIAVHAANVIIRNSKVHGVVWLDQDLPGSSGWSITVRDAEVDAGKAPMPAICCGMYTVQRVDAHGGQTAVQCENNNQWCTVEDSDLHGQYMSSPVSHLGGFLSDGSSNITLRHNFIVCDHAAVNGEGCTGDLNLIANFAPIEGADITRNLLGANVDSAYCTYAGQRSDSAYPPHKVVYRDNVFQRGTNRKCAAYGPATSFKRTEPTNVWSGNRWDDGTPLPAPTD